MAGKDRSQWSDAYRRRVERNEALGRTRQQARGHKAGEHVTRRTNKGLPPPKPRKSSRPAAAPPPPPTKAQAKEAAARALGQLTSKETAFVRRTAREIVRRGLDDPDDEDEIKEAINRAVAFATRTGFDNWKKQLGRQRFLAAQYKAGKKSGSFVEGGYAAEVEMWSWEDDGFDDISWYFYH